MDARHHNQQRVTSLIVGCGDRRRGRSGRLGRRKTDAWMPYNTPFLAQFLASAVAPEFPQKNIDFHVTGAPATAARVDLHA
jgi:hypothetical protein